jgi:hypothetical protein
MVEQQEILCKGISDFRNDRSQMKSILSLLTVKGCFTADDWPLDCGEDRNAAMRWTFLTGTVAQANFGQMDPCLMYEAD